MTQRYISALNNVDTKAAAIFKKHAKKRPLGDIHRKYGYTPPQPVLSCRTVNVDLSGTRTYRPKSTADILQEQHRLIHDIYTKNRNIHSAPNKQQSNDSEADDKNIQKINIEVQGRPLTSVSQISKTLPKKSKLKKRPKTTGSTPIKKSALRDAFMLVRVDKDVLDSARSSRELTNQIHDLWLPENHDLNHGTFMRGQKRPENNTEQFNAWLTFGGVNEEQNEGVVNAFTGIGGFDEYYSIDGNVGSKVAATLRKGDKVRIGVNGIVKSPSPRSRKVSSKPVIKDDDEFDGDTRAFDDLLLENFEEIIDTKPKKPDTTPLSWTDQVSKNDVKVVESIGKPTTHQVKNLCESHPVIFEKLVRRDERPKITKGKTSGFHVKHRLNSADVNQAAKFKNVKSISIDSRSEKDEDKVNNLTVEEVLRNTIAQRNKYLAPSFVFEKNKLIDSSTDKSSHKNTKSGDYDGKRPIRASSTKTRHGGDGNLLVPVIRSVPSTFVSTIDSEELMVSVPGTKNVPPVNEMPRPQSKTTSGRNSSSAISRSRISSAASHKYSQSSVDPEYIKFNSHIRNPKAEDRISPIQKPSVRFEEDTEDYSNISSKPDIDIDSVGDLTDRNTSPVYQLTHGYSINIPTADILSDRDSLLQSPYKKSDADGDLTLLQRRDMDLRNEQISQLTAMLARSGVSS